MIVFPKITICVPVYGVEQYISRCAISLFEQTYPNVEFLFINDATKDNSIGVLNETIKNYPQRSSQVTIVNHSQNKGLAGARNTGVVSATGDFIMWVDSDDSIDKTLVEKLVYQQSLADSDIVCFDIKVMFKDTIQIYKNSDYKNGKDLSCKMLSGKAPHQLCGHLIRRSLYIDNNIFAVEGINQGEDFQVMPRLAYYAKNVVSLHEALYFYDRTTEGSYSNSFSIKSARQIDAAFGVLRKFFENKGESYISALNLYELESIALE